MSGGEIADLSFRDHDTFVLAWRDPVFREFFYGTPVVFSANDEGGIGRLAMKLYRDEIEAVRSGKPE